MGTELRKLKARCPNCLELSLRGAGKESEKVTLFCQNCGSRFQVTFSLNPLRTWIVGPLIGGFKFLKPNGEVTESEGMPLKEALEAQAECDRIGRLMEPIEVATLQ